MRVRVVHTPRWDAYPIAKIKGLMRMRGTISSGRHSFRPVPWLFAAFVGVVFFLCQITEGSPAATDSLDASYSAVLGWALLNGHVWGRDIVFTFGPLGYFPPNSPYLPGNYQAYIFGQFAFAGAIAMTVAHLAATAGNVTRLAILAIALVWLPWLAYPQIEGIWYGFFGISAVALALQGERSNRGALVAWAAFYVFVAATLSLVKFTFWPLSVVWLLAVAAILWRAAGARWGIAAVAGYVAATLAWWMACRQPLSALPDYVRTSMQLVEGYGPAMALPPPRRFDVVGLATLVVGGSWALWRLLVGARARRWDRVAVFFLLGCVLYFAWRASFTRADEHMRNFLLAASLVGMAAVALATDAAPALRWVAVVVLLVLPASLIPIFYEGADPAPVTYSRWTDAAHRLVSRIGHAVDPMRARAAREDQWREVTQRVELPETRRMVGRDSIDMLGFKQGLVLTEGFNYRMRPVFQSYTVYTPELQRINQAFLDGPRSPQWILLEVGSIDGRLPMADDASSHLAVLRHYRPVLEEKNFLLLKRREVSAASPPLIAAWRDAAFDQWIDVPSVGAGQVASIELRPSLLGKLAALVFREPPVQIEVEDDQQVRKTFRFVRTQAQGVMLSPLITDNAGWLAWYTRSYVTPVRRVRIVLPEAGRKRWFDPRIRFGFSTLPEPRLAKSQLPAALDEFGAAGFNVRPSSRRGYIRRISHEGRVILFMHSPSQMRFAMPPGRYRFGATFGVLSDALMAPACHQADGIRLALYRVDGDRREELAGVSLNPFSPQPDPASASIGGLVMALEPGQELELAMEAAGNQDCDWGYVHALRVDAVSPSTPLSKGADSVLTGEAQWNANTLTRVVDEPGPAASAGQCFLDSLLADGRRDGIIPKGSPLQVTGWQVAASGAPAPRAMLELSSPEGTFRQRVQVGLPRPDVSAALNNPRAGNAGFSVSLPGGALPPGRFRALLVLEAGGKPTHCDLATTFELR
jgi:hypothetical protein